MTQLFKVSRTLFDMIAFRYLSVYSVSINRVRTAIAQTAAEVDKEVPSKLNTKHLEDHEEVGHECGLGNDWDVGGVD